MKSIARDILSKKEISVIEEIAKKYGVTVEELGEHLISTESTNFKERDFVRVSLTESEYNMLCERYNSFEKDKGKIIRLCMCKALQEDLLNEIILWGINKIGGGVTEEPNEHSISVAFGKNSIKQLAEFKKQCKDIRKDYAFTLILKWCLLYVQV